MLTVTYSEETHESAILRCCMLLLQYIIQMIKFIDTIGLSDP